MYQEPNGRPHHWTSCQRDQCHVSGFSSQVGNILFLMLYKHEWCLWLHLLVWKNSLLIPISIRHYHWGTLLHRKCCCEFSWCHSLQLMYLCSCFLVYRGTSWSSVQTKLTPWSFRPFVSKSFYNWWNWVLMQILKLDLKSFNCFGFSQLFWTTWTRNSTITSCGAGSGTAGISLSWGKLWQTTWLTAKPSAKLVRKFRRVAPKCRVIKRLTEVNKRLIVLFLQVIAPMWQALTCRNFYQRKSRLKLNLRPRSPWALKFQNKTLTTLGTCVTRWVLLPKGNSFVFFYPSFCVCGDDVAVAIVLKQIHVGL